MVDLRCRRRHECFGKWSSVHSEHELDLALNHLEVFEVKNLERLIYYQFWRDLLGFRKDVQYTLAKFW